MYYLKSRKLGKQNLPENFHSQYGEQNHTKTVVISGGSRISRRGGVDHRRGRFLAKMYVKTKELGPVGGRAPGTPPRSTNGYCQGIVL